MTKFQNEFRFLQWAFIKRIAGNQLAKIIGVVPLVGYLLLFNDQMIQALDFLIIAGAEETQPSPFFFESETKLRLTFFGSLSLFSAFVLFQIFCPRVLEGAHDEFGFSGRVRDYYSVYELASMEEAVMAESWVRRCQVFWLVLGKERARKPIVSGYRPDVRQGMFAKHGDYIGYLSREWWHGQMHAFRIVRYLSIVFALAGYLCLSLPTFDIMQAVIVDIWARS